MFGFLNKSGGVGWLVVFLGNPGAKYDGTRHNAGFMTARVCEKQEGLSISRAKFRALTARTEIGGQGVLLMMPQTYMNLSGEAVREAASFYKVSPEHVLVVSDDISLAPGRLRIRTKGSAGGHNGLKSIISCLGTDAFPRIKLGVGSPAHPEHEMIDWVLGSFAGADAKAMEESTARAWEAVKSYICDGAERAMNKFN